MVLQTPVIGYGATAQIPWSLEVAELLTFKDKFDEPYTMYEHGQGQPYMQVPRGLVSRQSVQHDHTVVYPVAQSIAVKPPRNADQAQCIERSLEFLQAGQDHIVEAPTGFGKTFVGCSVAGRLGQKTLIIVTKNDLTKGWRDTLMHLMGVLPSEIGHVQQDKCVYKGCKFVVAMVHSLVCRDYEPEFYQQFGLVIFDEVHRLGAEYFAQVCTRFPSRYRLGLSATPTRSDGRERLFHAHIGSVLVRGAWIPMKPKVLVKRTGWKPPMTNRRDADGAWKRLPMEVIPGRMMPVFKAMGADVGRNTEIASMVRQSYDAGRTILLLSDLIDDHLRVLFHYIVATGISGENIAYYIGGLTPAQREHAKAVRVVLGTYQMVSEGTDVLHWDTLVLCTPRSNVKQAIGRVMRESPGKRQPVVFDLLDENSVLTAFYYTRAKQYYSVGAEIVEV